ncbi:c-type cytochrome [Roseobacter sp. A03A-229]
MRFLLAATLCLAHPLAAQDAAEGERLFRLHCAACHGAEAEGNGPMAPVLLIQPSDLTTLTDRYDNAFPTYRVVKRIDGRDPLVSHGSDMPVYGWFFEGTGVAVATESGQPVMTSQPVADLVAWLKTIQD